MKIKRRMLACHASQRRWLKRHHHFDKYLEVMAERTRQEGRRAGLEYAETFIQHRGANYPTDNILRKLLGKLCLEL